MEALAVWIGYVAIGYILFWAIFVVVAIIEEQSALRLFRQSKFDGKGNLIQGN